MDLRAKLLAAFQVEYREHLEYIRSTMSKVEAGELAPDELPIDEVFRRAHSLKGAARATDLKPVETLGHRLETLFGRVRSGKAPLDGAALAVISQAGDAIEDWVEAFTETGDEPAEPAEALAAIDAFLEAEILAAPEPEPAQPAEASGPKPEPKSESKPKPKSKPAPTSEPDSGPEHDPVKKPVSATEARSDRPAATGQVAEAVRVRTTNLDRLLRSAGQLATENLGQEAVTTRLRGIEQDLMELERSWSTLRHAGLTTGGGPGSDSREDAKTDHRVSHMEQRIRGLVKEMRAARMQQQKNAWMYRQLGLGLQEQIRQVRMIPAESVFGDFRKMMRDLAKDEGREIEFRILGLSTEADRLVLQDLKDPVMHMLRNAIVHGIELPAEREAKGKPAKGQVILKFEIHGSRLSLLVDDDGRGIDVNTVAQHSLEAGLINEREMTEASSRDLMRHIFRPGFSTLGAVTDLGGRGMGLSVVYEAVGRLNGSLEVLDKEEEGTAFRIQVPLSVSSHRLLLVGCREQIFGLPTAGIERATRVRIADVKTVEGRPSVNIDGEPLPLRGMGEVLNLPGAEIMVHEGQMPILIMRSGDLRVAVAVDSFVTIRDAVIKDLNIPRFSDTKAVGGILMEDGSVSVVLSPFELVEAFRRPGSTLGLVTAEKMPTVQAPTIMVVDDSITTRTLEKSILEAHGYTVRIAVDGLDALMQIRSDPVDLVVSDVEMPRIDGFSLLKELKKDRQLAHIPVILVTSLRREDDLERGFSLGAEAYLVKQKFDQRELLETIEQIL